LVRSCIIYPIYKFSSDLKLLKLLKLLCFLKLCCPYRSCSKTVYGTSVN
jgi:hypothetical protein